MNGFAFYIGERSADIHNRNVSQLPRVRTEIQTGLPRLGEYILPYGGQEYEIRYECAKFRQPGVQYLQVLGWHVHKSDSHSHSGLNVYDFTGSFENALIAGNVN